MKIKFREATKHFMGKNESGGVLLEMRFCIECLHNRQWRLFGNDNGPYKFKTREERDVKLAELRAEVANASRQRIGGKQENDNG